MKEYIWKHRDKQWIKENPGQPTMYKEFLTKDEIILNVKEIIKAKNSKQYAEPVYGNNTKYDNRDKSGAGIYIILCEASKSLYVGQSLSMNTRMRNHKMNLLSSKPPLSAAYNKMRLDVFNHKMESFQFITYKPMPNAKYDELLRAEKEVMIYFMKEGYTLYNSDKPTNIYCEEDIKPLIEKLIIKVSKNPEVIQQIQLLID